MVIGYIVIAILVVSAVLFLFGKGGFLLAGYNTMPLEEKEKINEKKLLRWAGVLLLLIAAILALVFFTNIRHMTTVCTAAIVVICLGFVIFANSGFFKNKN